ncbi:hypothetical protein [Marinigracilibium pacificum]|uniref:Ligand-binding SRPBCC domain-containing protein n=1 Tax=Marinigracilibium pacificum TaxID=2729599 RepID=A0A848IT42_9BACT|nr:hypothetical protein [Marinigracilibium pacificum]NMM46946.1 hypothetical protein [Marinigracilibium pacificum]
MKIVIKTKVESSLADVERKFDRNLFVKLSPLFPKLNLLRFDGIGKGGVTQLLLDFILFSQEWVSINTHSVSSSKGFYFIDVGKKLPFPLKNWRHHHIIYSEESTVIVDRISYSTRSLILDLLMYPAMWLMFYLRKLAYKKYFKE